MKNSAQNIPVRTIDSDVLIIPVGLFSNFHSETSIWLPLAQSNFFSTTTLILYLKHWFLRNLKLYYSSMLSQVVTQHLSFLTKVRNPHGMLGVLIQKLHRHLWALLSNHFTQSHKNSRLFMVLELFTCVLYDKSTMLSNVNELRQELFSKKSNKFLLPR